jgi:hypothetical protein
VLPSPRQSPVLAQGGAPEESTSVPPQGTVVDRLARSLESATLAGEWEVARRLLAILEGLKAGATPPDGTPPDGKVIDLASRRKGGGGGGAP